MEQDKIQENEGFSPRQTQCEPGSGQAPKRLGARDLLLKELKDSGVTPDEDEDGRIAFWYGDEKHSEHIIAEASNDYNLIKLMDLNWHEVSQWDIEKVNELQKRVNTANIGNRAKIVYYFADDDKMWLSSIIKFPFTKEIRDRSALFRAELQCLEDTHRVIETENEKQAENTEEGGEE